MKRAFAISILVCMLLHMASRMGFISYLYENRHEIAYQLGVIDERPITMCSADYFSSGNSLILQEATPEKQQVPLQLAQSNEIILFSKQVDQISYGGQPIQFLQHNTAMKVVAYVSPEFSIFHPPCNQNAA